jgi:hypothetical protein
MLTESHQRDRSVILILVRVKPLARRINPSTTRRMDGVIICSVSDVAHIPSAKRQMNRHDDGIQDGWPDVAFSCPFPVRPKPCEETHCRNLSSFLIIH